MLAFLDGICSAICAGVTAEKVLQELKLTSLKVFLFLYA